MSMNERITTTQYRETVHVTTLTIAPDGDGWVTAEDLSDAFGYKVGAGYVLTRAAQQEDGSWVFAMEHVETSSNG